MTADPLSCYWFEQQKRENSFQNFGETHYQIDSTLTMRQDEWNVKCRNYTTPGEITVLEIPETRKKKLSIEILWRNSIEKQNFFTSWSTHLTTPIRASKQCGSEGMGGLRGVDRTDWMDYCRLNPTCHFQGMNFKDVMKKGVRRTISTRRTEIILVWIRCWNSGTTSSPLFIVSLRTLVEIIYLLTTPYGTT